MRAIDFRRNDRRPPTVSRNLLGPFPSPSTAAVALSIVIFGLVSALLMMLADKSVAQAPVAQAPVAQAPLGRPLLVLNIKGAIGFVSASRLSKAIAKATSDGAGALIIRLDTPGGLVSSTRVMIKDILASAVPIVVYVAPSGARAASAGTYLTYAANVAAMAPGTHLGAATPISMGMPTQPAPQQPAGDKDGKPASARERKVLNDAIAYIRSLAQLRGRNAEWAEKAVRDAATLTAEEAAEEGVIDFIAKDMPELIQRLDGRKTTTSVGERHLLTKGQPVIELETDWKMELMGVITDPNIAFILLMVGIYGILFEFWNPGAIVPGVIGGISLLLALTALSVLPVSYAGLALLLLGAGLMVGEAFAPGFGLLGIGGLVAFVLGAIFLFDPSDTTIPLAISWPVIVGVAATTGLFLIGVLGFAFKARERPVRTGAEDMVGTDARVVSWSGEEGRVTTHGEMWFARSSTPLSPGQSVRVKSISGLVLLVEPNSDG